MAKKAKEPFEILLSKYIAIWIWSILFGALSGLTYSFINGYYQIGKWGSLSLLLVILMTIGVLSTIQAWRFMFQYLVNYIIPEFLYDAEKNENKSDNTKTPHIHSSYWLRQSFLMMIAALAMRLALEISLLLFSVLQP